MVLVLVFSRHLNLNPCDPPSARLRTRQIPCGSCCARLATLAFASPLPQGSQAQRRQSNLQKDFYTDKNCSINLPITTQTTMNNSSTNSPLARSIKHLCVASAAAVLIFGAATAKADFTIYSQNYNSFANGTVLDGGVAGWYNWGLNPNNATVQGGALTISGTTDILLNFGSDLFSHGTNHIKIEYDLTSYQQLDNFFAPGDAPALDFVYNATAGFEHGSDRLYNFSGSGFDYGSQQFTGVSNPMTYHWTFDFEKSGTDITWSATFGSNPLFADVATKTYSIAAYPTVGLNTMEIYALGGAGTVLDNMVVTGIVPVPEPSSALLMVAGGVSLLTRRRRESKK